MLTVFTNKFYKPFFMFAYKIGRVVDCHMNKGIFAGIFLEVKAPIFFVIFYRCGMQIVFLFLDPTVCEVQGGFSIRHWGMPKAGYTV